MENGSHTTPASEESKTVQTPRRSKRWRRVLGNFLLLAFIGMQFYQPDKNNTDTIPPSHINTIVRLPDTVNQLLTAACYDCHSNNTQYPWYTNIQPVGWWLRRHITNGKAALNFDAFAHADSVGGHISTANQVALIKNIKSSVQESSMPLSSYKLIHADARLTKAQRKLVASWADSAIMQLRDTATPHKQ